ncbi:YjfK family protein [Pseudomonas sp. RIT-PI-S]|uniref:YjfK family protein n=1 Tax=Pseudomonas sp. RIT-PI-S TaxID=3035295 RepID=UPI0021D7E4FC|nr:YjfK family protein [Pseudomonas sp. RIT-PI-S]
MSWLKRAFGMEAPKPSTKAADLPGAPRSPMGLAPGRMICLSPNLKGLLVGESGVVVPDDDKVWAVGTIDLGQAKRLLRYYLDNEDYFVQFVMSGPGAEDIEDVILFGYHEVKTVASKAELLRLVGPQARIGMPYYELEGVEYSRQWGSEDGQTELAPLTEHVVNPEAAYTVHHNSMLYARDMGLTNRREFLLFSVEEDAEGNVSLTTSVGVSLQLTDITVL